jgi:uncharacterized protein (TIGR02266 family)
LESPTRRLTRQSADLIREFLWLNRRRIRPNPPLSVPELRHWEELRWRIEALLAAPRYGQRPARKALRVPTDLKVEYSASFAQRAAGERRPSDGEHEVLASVHEIAEGGLFLATESPPQVGTPLHLKLVGDDGSTTEVEGTVVWVRRVGERGGAPGVGVEFAHLDATQREAVACLVEQSLAAL